MRKTIKVTAYQVGHTKTRDVNTSVSFTAYVDEGVEMNTVAGTCLRELFTWVALQRKWNIKGGLMFSLPIDLKFELHNPEADNTDLFDTEKEGRECDAVAHKLLRQRLKMNNTAKSKRMFAEFFMDLFKYTIRTDKNVTFDEFMGTLKEDERYQETLRSMAKEAVAQLN